MRIRKCIYSNNKKRTKLKEYCNTVRHGMNELTKKKKNRRLAQHRIIGPSGAHMSPSCAELSEI